MRYDFIFIHREILPFGPPVIEWGLVKVFKRKIIYDFDDAIWLTDKINEAWFIKLIRWRSKVSSICKWSYAVSSGNSYLADYARQFNNNVHINPTTVDTENVHNPSIYLKEKKDKKTITIGWTGSHSTLKYLEEFAPVLQVIERKFPKVQFLVIADHEPSLMLDNLSFRRWSKETEIYDLIDIDIGLMPLPDDEWTRGKCGFKALQYLALGIPALVSPVGVNKQIVDDGINGYLCVTDNDWINSIEKLINDEDLRIQMGIRGRKKVFDHYSVASNSVNFLSFFEE